MESARQHRDMELTTLVDQVRAREFPYEARRPQRRDWIAYDDAQIHEIHDTLCSIRDAVDAAPNPPPQRGRGRPREYDPKDLAKVLLAQQYFEAANRPAQGCALLFKEKLGLGRVPHNKRIEHAYNDPDVRFVLDAVFAGSTAPARQDTHTVTLDGTGLPRSTKANWEQEKEDNTTAEARRRRFDGSVIMAALPSFLATAHTPLVVGFQNEAPTLETLLTQTARLLGGKLTGINVTGDAAFPSRAHCALISDLGATPFLFPKRNFTLAPKGSKAWRAMLDGFLDNTQEWLHAYHVRSASEAFNSRHKRRHPTPLRKIIDRRRETEKHARFTVDNLTQLGYLARARRNRPPSPARSTG